ncbi:MAG: sigma-70 family RNA polymerase sigma factor [Planctomycetia bacterium]|nr:sigma-70 family RNA polymerase sigma factor [Planctomycetia bacterium]
MLTTTAKRLPPAELPAYIFHSSFSEPGAVAQYGDLPTDDDRSARSHMPDEITRDCARRMHYAAFRAEQARDGRSAWRWRQRYLELRDRIILGNHKLVYRAVRRRFAPGAWTDDLIGECSLVLVRAVAAYNPWLNVRFSTYACTCLFRALARLGDRLHGDRLRVAGDHDLDTLVDTEFPDDSEVSWLRDWKVVMQHLREDDPLLSPREKSILERRFGLAGEHGPTTLDQVGRDLGLSKERVRQLQLGALGKLRDVLLASAPVS